MISLKVPGNRTYPFSQLETLRVWVYMTYKVESIDICLINPYLQAISYLRGCADKQRPVASKADMLGDSMLRPL